MNLLHIFLSMYLIFHSQLPLTHFSSCFFANYCHLLNFLKKSQNCNVTNFCIISNLFHHKCNDKNFSKGKKKPVSLQNQCPCETSVPAKPMSLRNQCKAVSLRNQFPCKINIGCRSSLSF